MNIKLFPTLLTIANALNITLAETSFQTQIAEATYARLVDLALKCGVSYCSVQGRLSTDESPNSCSKKRCSFNDETEIIHAFGPRSGEAGAGGYIAISHQTSEVFLVFRGTRTNSDWLSDVNFTPIIYKPFISMLKLSDWKCDNCLIHKGFYKSFAFFMKEPFDILVSLLQKNQKYSLIIAGHSLGGAMALLSGLEFKMMGYSPLIVTFGQPKISATYSFVDKINKIFDTVGTRSKIQSQREVHNGYLRVTHKGDIVQSLPPGFLHSGVELNILKSNLPHKREDVLIVQTSQSSLVDANDMSLKDLKVFRDNLRKWPFEEHREYFSRISGCD